MGENYDHPRRQIVQMITIIITVSCDCSVSPARYARNVDLPRNCDFVRARARSRTIKSPRRFQRHAHRRQAQVVLVSAAGIDTNAIAAAAFSRGLESAGASARFHRDYIRVNKSTQTVTNDTWYSENGADRDTYDIINFTSLARQEFTVRDFNKRILLL